jgi:hypothetical protein
VPTGRTQVVLGHVDTGLYRVQNAKSLRYHLDADAITGDDRKLHRVAVPSV